MDMLEQYILVVSDDARLCASVRRVLEARAAGLRVSAVSNVAAARRSLEEDIPAVILFEEASVVAAGGAQGPPATLDALVSSLAAYAPVVAIGAPEEASAFSALAAAGAVDFVSRQGEFLPAALALIERRLDHSRQVPMSVPASFWEQCEDFGEVLRHELNNPLTGILGNAELLLAEIRRKKDGRLPHGAEQRVETIAALAVRLRETVRLLSQEWEARHHPVP